MYFRHICKWLLQSHHNYKNIHLAAHFYSPLQLATAGSVIRFLLNLAFHLLSRIFSNISKVFGEECFLLQLVQKRGSQKKKEKKRWRKTEFWPQPPPPPAHWLGTSPCGLGMHHQGENITETLVLPKILNQLLNISLLCIFIHCVCVLNTVCFKLWTTAQNVVVWLHNHNKASLKKQNIFLPFSWIWLCSDIYKVPTLSSLPGPPLLCFQASLITAQICSRNVGSGAVCFPLSICPGQLWLCVCCSWKAWERNKHCAPVCCKTRCPGSGEWRVDVAVMGERAETIVF